MSTPADPALIAELAAAVTVNYCSVSVIALMMYYYLTTLHKEIGHYSRRKLTLATLLYTANRYIPLAWAFYDSPWISLSFNRRVCAAEIGVDIGLEELQYFPWAIFSALRTYALQRKLYWAIVVLILSLAPVILTTIKTGWIVIYEDPVNGCITLEDLPVWFLHRLGGIRSFPHMSLPGPVLARVLMIIADLIVITITWRTQYKTYNLGKELSTPMRLTTVVLRAGTLYFVVLTILNTLLLVFEYLQVLALVNNSEVAEDNASNLVRFAEPLTAILISEFLTHLHEAADRVSDTETRASVSALEFRIIGPIGATLPGPNEDVASDEAWDGDDRYPEGSGESQNGDTVSSGAEVEEVPRGEAEV